MMLLRHILSVFSPNVIKRSVRVFFFSEYYTHMMNMFKCLLIPIVVNAHGFMSVPATIYRDSSTMTSYIERVDGNAIFPGLKWNDSPKHNAEQLASKIYDGSFPGLKSFTDRYISGCPFNDLSKSIDVSKLSTLEWRNDQERKGFVESHEGPCEAWIDSTRVFNHTNCARAYSAYPAVLPIDYSVCKDQCKLEFYWLAMHESMWQMYKACAIINREASKYTTCQSRPL